MDERQHGGDAPRRGAQLGDRGRECLKMGPMSFDAEFTVVDAQPARRIAWRTGKGVPFVGDLVLELEALGPSSTRTRYGGSFQSRGAMRILGARTT